MKRVFVLFFFFIAGFSAYSQIIRNHYNKMIVYQNSGTDEKTGIMFNSYLQQQAVWTAFIGDWEDWGNAFVSFPYTAKNKTGYNYGRLVGRGYLIVSSIGTSPPDVTILNFKKDTENTYIISGRDCTKYISTGENGVIHFYTTRLNDGVDYNFVYQSDIWNYYTFPKLEPGEIPALLGFEGKDSSFFSFNEFKMIDEIEQDIIYDQTDIELSLLSDEDDGVASKAHTNTKKQPVYCFVIGMNGGVDDETSERVTEFLNTMCSFYNLYGKKDLDMFYKLFLSELDRWAAHYKKYEILTGQQLKIFRRECMDYKDSNLKENLEEM